MSSFQTFQTLAGIMHPKVLEMRIARWLQDGDITPAQAVLLRGPKKIESPSIPTLAKRLLLAISRWAREGFPAPRAALYLARRSRCEFCQHWSPLERWGLGRCHGPGCGCSRIKLWLPTERCPLGRWGSSPTPRRIAPRRSDPPLQVLG